MHEGRIIAQGNFKELSHTSNAVVRSILALDSADKEKRNGITSKQSNQNTLPTADNATIVKPGNSQVIVLQ